MSFWCFCAAQVDYPASRSHDLTDSFNIQSLLATLLEGRALLVWAFLYKLQYPIVNLMFQATTPGWVDRNGWRN